MSFHGGEDGTKVYVFGCEEGGEGDLFELDGGVVTILEDTRFRVFFHLAIHVGVRVGDEYPGVRFRSVVRLVVGEVHEGKLHHMVHNKQHF